MDIYRTISTRWRCGIHEEHKVSLRQGRFGSNPTLSSGTDFILIFQSPTGPDDKEETICLEVVHNNVQNATNDVTKPGTGDIATKAEEYWRLTHNVETFVKSSSQNSVLDLPRRAIKKLKKQRRGPVYLQINSPLSILNISDTDDDDDGSMVVTKPADTPINFRSVDDYCRHFQHEAKNHLAGSASGYYVSDCNDQQLYQQLAAQSAEYKLNSLHEIVKNGSQDPLRLFPRARIFHFGKALAEVVLSFHSTPWLPQDWRSKDIYLLGNMQSLDLESESTGPYLMLKFTNHYEGKGKQVEISADILGFHEPRLLYEENHNNSLRDVRNEMMFRLGVILLEIGYSKPWDDLRKMVPGKSEYLAAENLARDLARHMGLEFTRIIRKCLGCDFGIGETDFEDERLQELFFSQVVVTLDAMKSKLAALLG